MSQLSLQSPGAQTSAHKHRPVVYSHLQANSLKINKYIVYCNGDD